MPLPIDQSDLALNYMSNSYGPESGELGVLAGVAGLYGERPSTAVDRSSRLSRPLATIR